MKYFLLLVTVVCLSLSGCVEESNESQGKKPPILYSRVKWLESYDKAVEKSKETGKPIFAFFTGSDWCKYCELLDFAVLNTDAFAKWSKDNVVLLELDFPRSKTVEPEIKKVNDALMSKYGVTGFPTILFLAADGTPLLRTGYQPVTAEEWIRVVDEKLKESIANRPPKNAEKK